MEPNATFRHERAFGCYGVPLYELARGVDETEVIPDRPTKSVSTEDTFEDDMPLTIIEPMIRRLAEKTWTASRKELRIARTVVLKLKTSEFKILTRSHTPNFSSSSSEKLTKIALSLRERVGLARLAAKVPLSWRGPQQFPRATRCIRPGRAL